MAILQSALVSVIGLRPKIVLLLLCIMQFWFYSEGLEWVKEVEFISNNIDVSTKVGSGISTFLPYVEWYFVPFGHY